MEKEVILKTADGLLKELYYRTAQLTDTEAILAEQIALITANYEGRINLLKEEIGQAEKELRKLARKNKKVIFKDRDRVDLDHGALLHQIVTRVKRVKGMLARLKNHRIYTAIKKVESVNWDELEKWSDEKLAGVGTNRTTKELFEYELKSK